MNYILLFPDELRAESLGCYGNTAAYTPNIDALAAEGTMFRKNYTAHPVCTPSRNALVTGCYPHVHGFRTLKHCLSKQDKTFVKELREYGFDTCFSGKADCWDREGTMDAFSEMDPATEWRFYDMDRARAIYERLQKEKPEEILPHQYLMLKPPKRMEALEEDVDYKITSWACDKIQEHARGGKPFFMMLSLHAPHPVYAAYEKYLSLYPQELSPVRDESWVNGKPSLYREIQKRRELAERDAGDFRKVYAAYLAMISFVDEQVGRVVAALKKSNIYEDTTVIFCSDHGDFAGDAKLVEKWPNAMDDMLTRVPLIIRRPGCPQGHVVDTPTQTLDIFPTIFNFEGLKIRHPQFGISLKGRVAYCEGGYDASEPHCFEGTPLYCMHEAEGSAYYPKMRQQQESPETVCRAIMQRDNRYKLVVRTNGENELYDMEQDPLERKNLYGNAACKELAAKLEKKMFLWLLSTSDVTPYEGHFLT